MSDKTPIPTELNLHQKSRTLEIAFDDGSRFNLPCEYLRVYSPSAEVRGHGPGQGTLQLDKEKVNLNGSGISLGHPIGATGALITVKALYELQRTGGRYAVSTMCIGGGQGIAALFERI